MRKEKFLLAMAAASFIYSSVFAMLKISNKKAA